MKKLALLIFLIACSDSSVIGNNFDAERTRSLVPDMRVSDVQVFKYRISLLMLGLIRVQICQIHTLDFETVIQTAVNSKLGTARQEA